jgi:hypothetical protein
MKPLIFVTSLFIGLNILLITELLVFWTQVIRINFVLGDLNCIEIFFLQRPYFGGWK